MKKHLKNKEFFLRIIQVIINSIFFEMPFLKSLRVFTYHLLFPIGKNFHIGSNTILYCEENLKGKVEIGDNVSIGRQVILDYSGECKIGNNVCISHRAAIFTHEHPVKNGKYQVFDNGIGKKLVINDDVWIGYQSIILPSVNYIGKGAVVGAGSVVTKDIPDHQLVAGNPARLIRQIS